MNLYGKVSALAFLGALLVSSCMDSTPSLFEGQDLSEEEAAAISSTIEPAGYVPVSELPGVYAKEGTLHFDSKKSLEMALATLDKHSDAEMDAWEESLSFYSLRREFNSSSENPDVDDYELDQRRTPDASLETILNTNYEVVVAGKRYNLEEDIMKSIDPANPPTTPTGECRFQQDVEDEEVTNGIRQVGKKWNHTNPITSSLGVVTKLYRQNKRGKWKRSKEESVNLLLDQWHRVRWCKIDNAGLVGYHDCLQATDESRSKSDAWRVRWVIDRMVFADKQFCVDEFERVHHWANNQLNQDCHTESALW